MKEVADKPGFLEFPVRKTSSARAPPSTQSMLEWHGNPSISCTQVNSQLVSNQCLDQANCSQLSEHIYAPGVLLLAQGVHGLNAFNCDNKKVRPFVQFLKICF